MRSSKAEKKRDSFRVIGHSLKLFSSIIEKIIEHSDAKIEEIKRKVVSYFVIYGLFTAALFFILVGLIKEASYRLAFVSEGVAFIAAGSIMIVVLAAYSLIKKI